MLTVALTNGPLDHLKRYVPELRAYYWFPCGNDQWAYYSLDPNSKKATQTGRKSSGVKKNKVATTKIDAFYCSIRFNSQPIVKDALNEDVKVFLDAFEIKHGERPTQSSFR